MTNTSGNCTQKLQDGNYGVGSDGQSVMPYGDDDRADIRCSLPGSLGQLKPGRKILLSVQLLIYRVQE